MNSTKEIKKTWKNKSEFDEGKQEINGGDFVDSKKETKENKIEFNDWKKK